MTTEHAEPARQLSPSDDPHPAPVNSPDRSKLSQQSISDSTHLDVCLDRDDILAVEVRSGGEISVRIQRPGRSLKLAAVGDAIETLRKLHSAIGWGLADYDTRTARPYLLARSQPAHPTGTAAASASMTPGPEGDRRRIHASVTAKIVPPTA